MTKRATLIFGDGSRLETPLEARAREWPLVLELEEVQIDWEAVRQASPDPLKSSTGARILFRFHRLESDDAAVYWQMATAVERIRGVPS